ncbi:MAG: MerR family transcriptional regulator [Candidatus Marinimicrobia bacterium]|jgi:MerR family transcriptional regulator/heat shock protein HspR|nr:MerR family transcriptional regulator [Candidatus Neomarinimicrobiota bacterium]MBT3496401.1 MerR family transcriptional regulator [Candidatus Neomarinimicrobiota bacterium]MBT3732325.1 MerR family transcriptional regulator [Candidatus Neomarinimicrobiota bacterium]MBT4143647.1 MerR family transcriptional regulator [Candidatus Neomarinimicrobiota bacterium]MBT4176818.1 MerR family transcriptional regulator [Candidatus Neomarinimicrobiota bacterium]
MFNYIAHNVEPDPFEPAYAIGIVSKKIGVSPETLRLYERTGLLIPYRTRSGRRLFSQKDLEWLSCIRKLIVEDKLNLAGIRRLLALIPCWDIKPCTELERKNCPAYLADDKVCWQIADTSPACQDAECRECDVYLASENIDHLKTYYRMSQK